MKITSIRSPETFIFFLEEDEASLFNDEVFEPPTFRDAASNSERLSNRHNGSGNVGFGDGHVDSFNEIIFDNGAANNPISRMFFPDGGEWIP
jgi:prepilin-type processing-associated H-X9-DG protein